MLIPIVLGVMNLAVMVAIANIIATEQLWKRGLLFSRLLRYEPIKRPATDKQNRKRRASTPRHPEIRTWYEERSFSPGVRRQSCLLTEPVLSPPPPIRAVSSVNAVRGSTVMGVHRSALEVTEGCEVF
jgi:hypothetical protein